MAKSLEQMAEIVRAGGNLEPGYVFDAGKDEVRKMTADETSAADDSVAAETKAAKARAKVLADSNAVVHVEPTVNAVQS
jgi:hypothetical protein